MGVRKPAALHTSHHTKEELAVMDEENRAATGSRTCLEGKPPKELVDKAARDEWKRICVELRDLEIIGNLDMYALIGYCNSWSFYLKASAELAKQPLTYETEKGAASNPLINIQDKFAKQARDFASRAGISVNTRLQFAALKVKKDTDGIDDTFGL